MSDTPPGQARTMSGAMRAVIFATAIVLLVAGGFGLYLIAHLLLLDPGDGGYVPGGHKEVMFQLLWGIVAAAFVATGLSLFAAASRQRRTNMVPGPTLYILGTALVIVAMFLMSDGGWLSGTIIAMAGLATMWLEYQSANI